MLRDQLAKHMGSWVRGSVRSGGSSLVRVYSSGAGGSKDKRFLVSVAGGLFGGAVVLSCYVEANKTTCDAKIKPPSRVASPLSCAVCVCAGVMPGTDVEYTFPDV